MMQPRLRPAALAGTICALLVLVLSLVNIGGTGGLLQVRDSATTSAFHTYDGVVQQLESHAASAAVLSPTVSRHERRPIAIEGIPRPASPFVIAAEAELPAGYSSFSAAKTALGSPGKRNVFDHVVEQSQIGRSGFSPEEIHNPFNMNPVSAGTNQLKANYYSTKQFFTGGGTVRDWMNGQSFADQYEFGMDVLRRIENGLPLP